MPDDERAVGEALVLAALDPEETVQARAGALNAALAVTDRRLLVAHNDRLALNVPFQRIRRIQFDIEQGRPATLVVVPVQPHDEPQVLAVAPEDYEAAARALAIIGQRLAEVS
jgi:hypothetical protein